MLHIYDNERPNMLLFKSNILTTIDDVDKYWDSKQRK